MNAFGHQEREIQEEFGKWLAVCYFWGFFCFRGPQRGRADGEFRCLRLGHLLRLFGRRKEDINGEFSYLSFSFSLSFLPL